MKEKKFSQSDCMDPYAVDILKSSLVSCLGVLLGDVDHFNISSKLELNQVFGINLEIVGTFEGMDHLHLAVDCFHTSLTLGAQVKDVDSYFINGHEIHVLGEVESLDLGFPELKAFMSVEQPRAFWTNIYNSNIVGINEDCLVTDY